MFNHFHYNGDMVQFVWVIRFNDPFFIGVRSHNSPPIFLKPCYGFLGEVPSPHPRRSCRWLDFNETFNRQQVHRWGVVSDRSCEGSMSGSSVSCLILLWKGLLFLQAELLLNESFWKKCVWKDPEVAWGSLISWGPDLCFFLFSFFFLTDSLRCVFCSLHSVCWLTTYS